MLSWQEPILPQDYRSRFDRVSSPFTGITSASSGVHEPEQAISCLIHGLRSSDSVPMNSEVDIRRYRPGLPPMKSVWTFARNAPILTYMGSLLLGYPSHVLMSVFLAEWVAIVKEQFLWSAADRRLDLLPDAIIRHIRWIRLGPLLVKTSATMSSWTDSPNMIGSTGLACPLAKATATRGTIVVTARRIIPLAAVTISL